MEKLSVDLDVRGIVVFCHLQKSVNSASSFVNERINQSISTKTFTPFLQTHEEHFVLQHLQPILFHFLLLEQQVETVHLGAETNK